MKWQAALSRQGEQHLLAVSDLSVEDQAYLKRFVTELSCRGIPPTSFKAVIFCGSRFTKWFGPFVVAASVA